MMTSIFYEALMLSEVDMWQAGIVVAFFILAGLLSGAMQLPAALAVIAFASVVLIIKWRELNQAKRILATLSLKDL